jgi:hypothetical protein
MYLKKHCEQANTVAGIQQHFKTTPLTKYTIKLSVTGNELTANKDQTRIVISTSKGEKLQSIVFTASSTIQNSGWDMVVLDFMATTTTSRVQIWADSSQCIIVDDVTILPSLTLFYHKRELQTGIRNERLHAAWNTSTPSIANSIKPSLPGAAIVGLAKTYRDDGRCGPGNSAPGALAATCNNIADQGWCCSSDGFCGASHRHCSTGVDHSPIAMSGDSIHVVSAGDAFVIGEYKKEGIYAVSDVCLLCA